MVPPTKINSLEIKTYIANVLPSGASYEIKIDLSMNYGITKSPICLVLLEPITFEIQTCVI